MGGPLVVGTIAYGVTGAMLLWRKRQNRHLEAVSTVACSPAGTENSGAPDGTGKGACSGSDLAGVDTQRLARDQTWFLAIFTVKVSLGLVAFAIKPWLGLAFFAVYILYFVKEMTSTGEQASGDDLEPLKLQPRRAAPTTIAVTVQIVVTLAIIFGASQLFVKQLEWAGPALGLPSVVVALLLSPIATELPEIMNAIIWVRQGKTQLALANISGAMMIQATVPSGIGILFTPWLFDAPLMIAGAVTMGSVSYLLWLLRTHRVTAWKLTGAAGFYVVFAIGLVLTL